METPKQNSTKIVFKWTIIYVITSIVITYTFQILNIDQTSSVKYIAYIPFVVYMFLAQKEYKDQLGGYLSYGQGFLTGFLYSLFSGILLAVFVYLYLSFLNPALWQQTLATARQEMVDKGTMTDDQINMAMQMTNKFGIIFATIGTVILSAFFGAIIALITSAILKKEQPIFDTETDVPTDPAA